MNERPVQDLPRPSPNVTWDRLQPPAVIDNGWIDITLEQTRPFRLHFPMSEEITVGAET